MTAPPDLAERRHAETIEQLRRVNVALEAVSQDLTMVLHHATRAEAQRDAILQWLVRTWQAWRAVEN